MNDLDYDIRFNLAQCKEYRDARNKHAVHSETFKFYDSLLRSAQQRLIANVMDYSKFNDSTIEDNSNEHSNKRT